MTYKLKTPKATLKIFSTGSITVTGMCCVKLFRGVKRSYMELCVGQLPTWQTYRLQSNIFTPWYTNSGRREPPRTKKCTGSLREENWRRNWPRKRPRNNPVRLKGPRGTSVIALGTKYKRNTPKCVVTLPYQNKNETDT